MRLRLTFSRIVICTANLLPQDWRMCQAVWRSPILPRLQSDANVHGANEVPAFATGARFKFDLLAYIGAYGSKLKELHNALRLYDFSEVKGCLIASTPSRQNLTHVDISTKTLWGWPAMQQTVRRIPNIQGTEGNVVAQVSSIATLGVTSAWLHGTLYRALQGKDGAASEKSLNSRPDISAKLSIVYPTADEVRRTIDGYACGGSIHMKLQTAANQKQLNYVRPHLRHWAGDGARERQEATSKVRDAGRKRTGPHIKTYLRFTDAEMTSLDWAMITSANLSKQAWGTEASAKTDEVRISSFEIGVLFWPALWKGNSQDAVMVPVFKKDLPAAPGSESESLTEEHHNKIRVGWRMPYDLPLVPYSEADMPWSTTQPHLEPDWKGQTWGGQ